jgi:acyl-CoA synthetase (AMP-forming)/AMP-acid ligase II
VNLIGAVFQPVHLPYRSPDLRFFLGHSGAKAFVGLARRDDCEPAREVLALRPDLPALRHVVTVDAPLAECVTIAELMRSAGTVRPMPSPDAACLLLYTSGTTSNPKGAPHSHRTLMSAAAISSAEFGLSGADRVMTLSRFSHMWGALTLLMTLHTGATGVLLPSFTADRFAELVEAMRPSFVFGAPIHLIQTFREGLLARHDFSSIRVVATSGTVFPADQMQPIRALLPDAAIGELWGMTEIGPGAFTRPGAPPEQSAGTVGTAIPGCEMRIVSADGRPAGDGEPGELEVRGAGVFTGYLGNPDANAASFTADGWFKTGDLAEQTPEGAWRITGRVKEVINRGGVKLNPSEVEKTLLSHPRIKACAIVPVADPLYGERACCCAVVEGKEALTLEELCGFLRQEQIGKNMWPERLELFDALPMTPTGKVSKGTLTELVQERAALASAAER